MGIFHWEKVKRFDFIACIFYIIYLVSFKSGKLRKINTKVFFFIKFVTICMNPFYVKWPIFVENYICLEWFLTKWFCNNCVSSKIKIYIFSPSNCYILFLNEFHNFTIISLHYSAQLCSLTRYCLIISKS